VVVHESGCISALTFFLLANLAKLPAGMKDPSVHQTKDPDKHAQKRTPNTGLIFVAQSLFWQLFLNLFCRKLIW
jgi:hypothetical protein